MTKFGRNNILYTGCTYVAIQMIYQLYEQKGGNGVHKGGFQSRVRAGGGCSVQFLHHLFPAIDFVLPTSPLSAIVLYIAGILVVGIPLVSLVFAIFRPVFNWQPMVSGLKWTLLILWIVSATIFFICYTMQGFTFPELLMRG